MAVLNGASMVVQTSVKCCKIFCVRAFRTWSMEKRFFATKRGGVSKADRWDAENEILFGSKQKAAVKIKKKSLAADSTTVKTSAAPQSKTKSTSVTDISKSSRKPLTSSKTKKTTGGVSEKRRDKETVLKVNNLPELDFVLRCPLFPEHSHEMTAEQEQFQGMVQTFGLRVNPSVKTIMNKTRPDLSNFFLQRWRLKMIEELGDVGFKKHQEATIWNGVNLHACVQQYLTGVEAADIQIQENIHGYWDSLSSVFPDVTEVQAVETEVSHSGLLYKGIFDCMAKYKDVLYVIDWKTSSKPKPLLSSMFDNPLQVVAYLGAINSSPDMVSKFGVVEQAAIVVAYPNGEAAHVHRMSPAMCQEYWVQWCQRLHQFWGTVAAEKAG